jgi:hypothetical protein
VSRRKRCTRLVKAGSFAPNARRGAKRVAFAGGIAGNMLAPGHYRLMATPIGVQHHMGHRRSATFTIIRGRPLTGAAVCSILCLLMAATSRQT